MLKYSYNPYGNRHSIFQKMQRQWICTKFELNLLINVYRKRDTKALDLHDDYLNNMLSRAILFVAYLSEELINKNVLSVFKTIIATCPFV